MDKIIDILLASLRARRLLAAKYSDNRELEMLNAQEDIIKDLWKDLIKAAVKAKGQAEAVTKEKAKRKSKILVPTVKIK